MIIRALYVLLYDFHPHIHIKCVYVMASILVYFFISIIFLSDPSLQQEYVVPESTVELLYPKGFSVSIPGKCCRLPRFPKKRNQLEDELCIYTATVTIYVNDRNLKHVKASCRSFYYVYVLKDKEGVRLFAFHGKLNEDFDGREGGVYSKDITSPKNNKWTYTDKTTRFKIGDTINYWLYVDYFDGRNKLGYLSEHRKFSITECPGNLVDGQGFCTAPDPSEYNIPDATIEILQPRGFSVSIPDHEGITLFAFHGNINESFDGREAGRFAKDITAAKNGKWTFVDRDTKLKPGDIIYYWLYVIHGNNKGYVKDNQKYVVKGDQDGTPTPCLKSLTMWNGNNACMGQLLFEDEFDFLNSNNWMREIKFADDPDYEFVIYEKFKENLDIKQGKLHIKPTLADDRFGEGFIYLPEGYDLGSSCTTDIQYECKRSTQGGFALPPILSGRLNSISSFKYGRVDIKAKLPKGDWIYPQLFLSPKYNEYGKNNYDSGEIRIAFVSGNRDLNGDLQGVILLGTSPVARKFGIRSLKKINEGWSDTYHVFSVIWKPDSLMFLVDNEVYGKIEPPQGGFANAFSNENHDAAAKWRKGTDMAPFDKEMIIKIGVGVGGHSFPDGLYGKPYTNTEAKPQTKFYKAKYIWKSTWDQKSELIVDYVKIYAI